jgi:hypothetical protein
LNFLVIERKITMDRPPKDGFLENQGKGNTELAVETAQKQSPKGTHQYVSFSIKDRHTSSIDFN